MEKTADAVVVGGGIMGASVAHFLAKKKFGKVVLLEKGTLAGVSTGRSAANVRTYYSNPVTVKLAWRAVQFFENDRCAVSTVTSTRSIEVKFLNSSATASISSAAGQYTASDGSKGQ